MTRFSGSMLVCSFALLLGGCDRTPDAEAEERSEERAPRRGITSANIGAHTGALVEEHQGKVAVTWVVTDKGVVRAKVMRGDTPVEKDVKGTVDVTPEGGAKKTHELDLDDGLLEGDIGALEAGVTEMRYALDVGKDETLRGVLHLPKSGTAGIADNARKTADSEALEGSGPHGGTLQRVGSDVVEVVGQKNTGEVRVYVLNDKLETVDPGDREIRLIASGAESDNVKLVSVEGQPYLKGKVKLDAHPVKLTVVVVHDHDVHVALCGHRPGHTIVVHDHHHAHPFVLVFIVEGWHHDHDHHDHHDHVHVKYKNKHKHKGHGGSKIHVHVH